MSDPLPPWLIEQRQQIGERVRQVRMTRALSQERLAEAAGLDRNTIGRLEAGTRSTRLDHLLRIAHTLDVPAALLLTPLSPDETWPPPR